MKTIAFLGDSITVGYTLEDQTLRYSTLVSKRLGAKEENYGISGTLIAKSGRNKDDGQDFISRKHLIDSADIAIIFGGTNDYFWSDTHIKGEKNDSYFEHAVQSLCEHVRTARAGKITLFITPYPHHGEGNFLGGKAWNEYDYHDTTEKNFNGHILIEYASTIEEVCKKYEIPCLNLFKDFPFDWRKHTTDGCHPNPEGHEILASVVERKLLELIK